jgi:hypothetical protein
MISPVEVLQNYLTGIDEKYDHICIDFKPELKETLDQIDVYRDKFKEAIQLLIETNIG